MMTKEDADYRYLSRAEQIAGMIILRFLSNQDENKSTMILNCVTDQYRVIVNQTNLCCIIVICISDVDFYGYYMLFFVCQFSKSEVNAQIRAVDSFINTEQHVLSIIRPTSTVGDCIK